jgi:hypothetical protein
MWREYAMAWDGRVLPSGIGKDWVEKILRIPREECLRLSRSNLYAARFKRIDAE